MDDVRLGNAMRLVRIRGRLRQADVARRARVSRQLVGRLERGRAGRYPMDTVRAVANALGMRIEVRARWQGSDLDRLVNAAHARLHESVARELATLSGWRWLPEVTFASYGERGVIDILAWHPASRSLLIIELRSELVDPQDLVATMHRRVRLGREIARGQGWDAVTVSAWVIVRDTSTSAVASNATVTCCAGRSRRRDGRCAAGSSVHAERSQGCPSGQMSRRVALARCKVEFAASGD